MELYQASKQWMERPNDERFWTLEEMKTACENYKKSAVESNVKSENLRVEVVDNDIRLTGKSNTLARLTHWAFGQLSRLVKAPADYLRNLPATLSVQNLNHGLKKLGSKDLNLMFHQNGSLILRSALTDRYERLWNTDVVSRIIPFQESGWRTPPARPARNNQPGTRIATEQDVIKSATADIGIKVGDTIAPAGLYASDHDMFAFLVDDSHPIDSGSGKPMFRGFFVWNSEVGAASLGITTFLYDSVCGNHIVWGASNVKEIRLKHIGEIDMRYRTKFSIELKKYSESSAGEIETMIVRARKKEIAKTKDEVLDLLFGKHITSRKNLELGYELAEQHQRVNGNPNTVWGMVSGLTRLSQETNYADERNNLDRCASKVLQTIEF